MSLTNIFYTASIFIAPILAVLLITSNNLEALQSPLEAEKNCVAYVAGNTLALVKKIKVVGKTCEISAQIVPDVGGVYYVEVDIDSRTFTSGESERDRDVKKILKAEKYPKMIFHTVKLDLKKWKKLFKKKAFDIKGHVHLAAKMYDVSAKVVVNKDDDKQYTMSGVILSSFKNFGLEPPKIAGGLMAKVTESLELHFNILSETTLGADILLE